MSPIETTPPSAAPRPINVVEPVSQALHHVKQMLFQPFDLGRWFVIGFCAWLAFLGESGGGGVHGPGGGGGHGGNGGDIRRDLEQARDYILANLDWLVPLVATVVIVGLGLWLLVLWLNSRGKFMFLHCVALNRAEVSEPWRQFARQGNSLFLFRLCLALFGMVLTVTILTPIIFIIIGMVGRGAPDVGSILGIVCLVLTLIGMGVGFAIIQKLTTDFVVPIMFKRRNRCLEAWREFWKLLMANLGWFVLYLLFSILLAVVLGLLIMMVLLVTCCVCCLALLPYIGTVLLLPVFVFKRSYSLFFFAQFGAEYDVFLPPPAPGSGPMSVAPPAM